MKVSILRILIIIAILPVLSAPQARSGQKVEEPSTLERPACLEAKVTHLCSRDRVEGDKYHLESVFKVSCETACGTHYTVRVENNTSYPVALPNDGLINFSSLQTKSVVTPLEIADSTPDRAKMIEDLKETQKKAISSLSCFTPEKNFAQLAFDLGSLGFQEGVKLGDTLFDFYAFLLNRSQPNGLRLVDLDTLIHVKSILSHPNVILKERTFQYSRKKSDNVRETITRPVSDLDVISDWARLAKPLKQKLADTEVSDSCLVEEPLKNVTPDKSAEFYENAFSETWETKISDTVERAILERIKSKQSGTLALGAYVSKSDIAGEETFPSEPEAEAVTLADEEEKPNPGRIFLGWDQDPGACNPAHHQETTKANIIARSPITTPSGTLELFLGMKNSVGIVAVLLIPKEKILGPILPDRIKKEILNSIRIREKSMEFDRDTCRFVNNERQPITLLLQDSLKPVDFVGVDPVFDGRAVLVPHNCNPEILKIVRE